MNKDLIHHELLKDLRKGRNCYYVCINRTTHWYNNLRKIDENKIIDKNSIVLFTEDYGGIFYPFSNYFGVNYKMSDFRLLTFEEYDYYIVKGNKKYVDNIKEEDKSSQSYTKGAIVYPTYEGVKRYSDQFSNSISGEVLRISNYKDWISVKWSNNKGNSYPENCITTDFNKSVYVTHRKKYRPKSKFDENLPENTVKEIWLNVGNNIDDVLSFTRGTIVECFLFKDSKQGESFWYEFSNHYSMSRFDECVKMFKDDYWVNYKLKESDLIDCLKDYPIDIAQHYYDLCIKYCNTCKSKILTSMQDQNAYGFTWNMEPEGFDWYTVRINKNFKAYDEHFKKTSKVENENTPEPKWSYKHDMFNKDNVSELSVHAVSYTHEDTKDSLEGEPKVTQPKMKRFKENKTVRHVKKVSVEVNVKR